MKLAITADIHFNNWVNFSKLDPETGVNTRLITTHKVLKSMADIAVSNGITNIVWNGDVFHVRNHIDTIVMEYVLKTLQYYKSLGITTHINVGNHDQAVLSGEYHALSCFKNFKEVIVYDKPTYSYLDDYKVLWIPYIHEHSKIQYLLNNPIHTDIDLIIGHFGVFNAKTISTDYRIKDGINLSEISWEKYNNLKHILLGHYHTRQILKDSPLTLYVGNPLQHSFQDEGQDKGFYVLDGDNASYTPLKAPFFKSLFIKDGNNLIVDKNYYRIYCEDFLPTVDLYEMLEEKTEAFEIIYKSNKKTKDITKESLNINQIISEYVRKEVSANRIDVYNKIKNLISL